MTDRVENNLFKQTVTTTNTTTNPPKQVGLGDSLIGAGQLLAGMGAQDAAVRAAYNNAGGCFGYGFGGWGGNFFPVPGLDASDIWARTRMLDNFNGIGDIMKGVNNIGTTNASGVTDDATAAQKTHNPADTLSKLDYEKIKEAAAKEQEIADKEAELKAEKDKKDAADKEKIQTLSKELYNLRKEYAKLDKELGDGKELSKQFGGKGSFYKNISETEFTQIQDINNEIKEMKGELKKLEEEGAKLAQEYTNTKQKLMNAGKATDEQSVINAMSEASRARFTEIKEERETKITEIETKIKELKSFIEKAGKDDKETDFYTHTEEKSQEAKKKAGSPSNVAGQIKSKLYADGKLRKKDDVLNELKEGKTEEEAKNIEEALDLLYHDTTDDMSAEDHKTKLGGEAFFKNMQSTNDLLNKPETLAVLQKTYDGIVGSGKFNENGKKYAAKLNGTPYWTKVEEAIAKAGKKVDAPSTPPAGQGATPPAGKAGAGATPPAEQPKPKTPPAPLTSAQAAVASAKDRQSNAAEVEAVEAENNAAKSGSSAEDKAKAEKARAKAEFIKKMNNGYTEQEITDAKDRLAGKSKISALEDMDDALFVRVFCESSHVEAIKDSCYEPKWNEYENMKAFCARMNEICAKYGISERLCTDTNWLNTIEFKTPDGKDIKEITSTSNSSDFSDAACTTTIVGTYKDHTFEPLHQAALRIKTTVR